jgi:formamidopyrimidine-DNA glycosylase
MPELPEVETVRRGLADALVGRQITQVTIYDPRLRWPVPATQKKQLEGRRLERIDRRSKYLLFRFDRGALIAHLGMTGSFWVYQQSPPTRRTHDHIEWIFDDGTMLRFNDPRRFGSLHWMEGERHPLLDALGPEPLTDAFNAQMLYASVRSRTGAIKTALMDNHLVVGVGNIYASESLFRAGIHPNRPAQRISLARCGRLVDAVKATLTEAIKAGGSTLRDFVNSAGEPGSFQLNYFAYGRADEPCRVCGTPIRLMRHAGRATYYCIACQR